MCSLAAGLLVIPYMIYYMYPTMTVDVLLVGLRAISTGFRFITGNALARFFTIQQLAAKNVRDREDYNLRSGSRFYHSLSQWTVTRLAKKALMNHNATYRRRCSLMSSYSDHSERAGGA